MVTETTTNLRYQALKKLYGEEKFNRLYNAKVLIVGAGGIGCEVS
jgi:tRNA A37 threonylcarbamoyladenosine dehydratase